ncbi:16S rRNA (guanine(527)-N(7))-methyltransferase RsmG [Magnetococcus sp. PR-3]|uniref:16S rRNA (guanine(527)-N(7))-methyltransferase RsmG n=1 Tax=Magnetococcus sp. PR-3 TaxID=3120355 RepID=UPI002FCE6271
MDVHGLLSQAGVDAVGLQLHDGAKGRLAGYVQELLLWNKRINLIGKSTETTIWSRHIVESLVLLPFVAGKVVADIGTGAGIPGLPLSLVLDDKEVEMHLVEKVQKKVSFLTHIKSMFDLDGVWVYGEVLGGNCPAAMPAVDVVTSRALADVSKLVSLGDAMLKPGASFVLLKGPEYERELSDFEKTTYADFYDVEEVRRVDVHGRLSCVVVLRKK